MPFSQRSVLHRCAFCPFQGEGEGVQISEGGQVKAGRPRPLPGTEERHPFARGVPIMQPEVMSGGSGMGGSAILPSAKVPGDGAGLLANGSTIPPPFIVGDGGEEQGGSAVQV